MWRIARAPPPEAGVGRGQRGCHDHAGPMHVRGASACGGGRERATDSAPKRVADIERLKKIRNHRGLRHYWQLRVRGQKTKTTGRRGRTVGVSSRKP